MKEFILNMLGGSNDVSSKRTFAFLILITLFMEAFTNLYWHLHFDSLIHNDMVTMFLFLTGYSTIEKFKPQNQIK